MRATSGMGGMQMLRALVALVSLGSLGNGWAASPPKWLGVWYTDDGIFDRVGLAPSNPQGPGPGLFDRILSAHPPYNATWEARYRAARAAAARAAPPVKKGCTFYFPAIMEAPYAFEVLITPEETVFIFENGAVRHVLTDGRRHPPPEDRWATPWGDSVGHWEGDTLVVDTISVAKEPTPFFAMVSDAVHFSERIRMAAPDRLEDRLTIIDPVAFTHPWTVTLPFKRVKNVDRIVHGDCAQNDRDAIVDGKFELKPP
ncbi:MAG: hypothetical protein ACREUT_09685 [Steroidobacteraceae bacterium]